MCIIPNRLLCHLRRYRNFLDDVQGGHTRHECDKIKSSGQRRSYTVAIN